MEHNGNKPAARWLRARAIKLQILDRCRAYCTATGTPESSLSLALTSNPRTLFRITSGGDIGLDTYDGVRDELARLERMAGLPVGGAGWPTGNEMRETLLSRCQSYCEATGLAPTRLSVEIANNTALMSRLTAGDMNIRLDTYDTWMTALDRVNDRLRAHLSTETGTANGQETQQSNGADQAAGHRHPGQTLHRAHPGDQG
jgi:hypothetical protein